jgi:hypothetical protein
MCARSVRRKSLRMTPNRRNSLVRNCSRPTLTSRISLLCVLQDLHHRIRAGVEHHGSALPRGQNLGCFLFVLGTREQVSTMELEREVGILEQVASQDQHHGFVLLHKSLFDQLLQSGESDR